MTTLLIRPRHSGVCLRCEHRRSLSSCPTYTTVWCNNCAIGQLKGAQYFTKYTSTILHDTTGCTTGCYTTRCYTTGCTVVNPVGCLFTRRNRLSNRLRHVNKHSTGCPLFNRLDKRLYHLKRGIRAEFQWHWISNVDFIGNFPPSLTSYMNFENRSAFAEVAEKTEVTPIYSQSLWSVFLRQHVCS